MAVQEHGPEHLGGEGQSIPSKRTNDQNMAPCLELPDSLIPVQLSVTFADRSPGHLGEDGLLEVGAA